MRARELAQTSIAGVYQRAERAIIATNVGSTKFYFSPENNAYLQNNLRARKRGISVVRFYLYSKFKHIEMHDGNSPDGPQDFFNEVKYLHERLGSLYSAMINVDDVMLPEYRDFLIMDDKFVAETCITPDWVPLRAEATEDEDQLNSVRQYFQAIYAAVDKRYVVTISNSNVNQVVDDLMRSIVLPASLGGQNHCGT